MLGIVVCIFFYLLPETHGKELPNTVEDLKAWFSGGNTGDSAGNGKRREMGDIETNGKSGTQNGGYVPEESVEKTKL